MSPYILLAFVIAYFGLLLIVAYFTSRKSDNNSFFIGNRNSNWMLVAFGMIGTSLSGVTFVSVPGGVYKNGNSFLFSSNSIISSTNSSISCIISNFLGITGGGGQIFIERAITKAMKIRTAQIKQI
jgi:Na+/proline symporter